MSPVPPVKVCVACEESSRTSLERCEWCGSLAGTFLIVSVALVVRCLVWLVGRLG